MSKNYPSLPKIANHTTIVRKHSATNYNALLKDIDWSFAIRNNISSLESIHPYPAKFIPEIPSSLLDNLPITKGTAVLDPFVGSGTTLVECQKRGIPSIGIDLNPIACLISRVKTAPIPANGALILNDVIGRARSTKTKTPLIPNIDHWFTPGVQSVIAPLIDAISNTPLEYQDFLRLSLSSILVRISNQESDTRYAAINKKIDPTAVVSLFENSAQRILRALAERQYDLPSANVIEHDTLKLPSKAIPQKIGAVITSPPYPNAYEYWLYHKYRMYWLGFDPIAVKNSEIGARAHFFKTNHHTEDDFVRQMEETFALINKVLIAEGYAAFVVGRSKIHGKIIDNGEIVENAAQKFGFKRAFKIERTIASSRKSFNLSHANIKTETVLVLTR